MMVRALVAEPVVVPVFMFNLVASDPGLASLDAPEAGGVWADATAVTANDAATTMAVMAGLHRMAISSSDCDAKGLTGHPGLGSMSAQLFKRKACG
ncbi:MAG TPA: hypothetical protein VK804_32090 [Bradyrhizobium sp.]|uniref:hypothetical protein n=1 Tax=Bradyrhizobium sp. TaxID=376 RepID=UPI002C90BC20|nr:hypothetical protein [Bradyrhizobium sp.]HTB05138.1 hypothetical protein [Bradyrhizobium sp.]